MGHFFAILFASFALAVLLLPLLSGLGWGTRSANVVVTLALLAYGDYELVSVYRFGGNVSQVVLVFTALLQAPLHVLALMSMLGEIHAPVGPRRYLTARRYRQSYSVHKDPDSSAAPAIALAVCLWSTLFTAFSAAYWPTSALRVFLGRVKVPWL